MPLMRLSVVHEASACAHMVPHMPHILLLMLFQLCSVPGNVRQLRASSALRMTSSLQCASHVSIKTQPWLRSTTMVAKCTSNEGMHDLVPDSAKVDVRHLNVLIIMQIATGLQGLCV